MKYIILSIGILVSTITAFAQLETKAEIRKAFIEWSDDDLDLRTDSLVMANFSSEEREELLMARMRFQHQNDERMDDHMQFLFDLYREEYNDSYLNFETNSEARIDSFVNKHRKLLEEKLGWPKKKN